MYDCACVLLWTETPPERIPALCLTVWDKLQVLFIAEREMDG